MLTKIKRIRRKKYAAGDEARKFQNIPTASQPQQQTVGNTSDYLDRYVNKQVTNPNVATDAEQSYTSQTVQADELLSGSTLASPTAIGANTITKKAIATPTAGVSSQTSTPSAFNVSSMTGATGTAQTGTAQTGTVGTNSQVGTVTGSLSGTATGATGGPSSSAIAQAASGQLSSGALAQVISGTAATVAGQTATLPGAIQAAVASNPAQLTATIQQQPAAVQA